MKFICPPMRLGVAALVLWGISVGAGVAGAAPSDAEISEAIQRGVKYLKQGRGISGKGGAASLAAFALLKAEEPADSPEVTAVVENVLSKIDDGVYRPTSKTQHIYEAGVDLMLLADADGRQFRPQIEAITQYIVSQQGGDGSWDYPDRKVGDTSISQYGILGLWAASRVGIEIAPEVWDRAAAWHLKNQFEDGGFAYHPGLTIGSGAGNPTLNMTGGGTGSLLIARLHLFPQAGEFGRQRSQRAETRRQSRFGVLEPVDLGTPRQPSPPRKLPGTRVPASYTPQSRLSAVDEAIRGGLKWIDYRFQPVNNVSHNMYYYYTIERLAALAGFEEIANRDWFGECAAALLKMQADDGSWKTHGGQAVGTSFAILFLTRSTAKLLGQPTSRPIAGGGLLAGGRGLPDNLAEVDVRDGKVKRRKLAGPVEELLAALENPESPSVEGAQAALVEKVQIGDPEALIGQRERLLELVKDPRVEVRRTALWALGRSGEIPTVPVLIEALEDTDIDVMVEARNALCYLSRRPRGFGLPESPLHDLPEDASDEEREAAISQWQAEAVAKWRKWHLNIRPYDERDDLLEADFRRR